MTTDTPDIITPDEAKTLAGLFRARVRRSPDAPAYRYFDDTSLAWQSVRWADMARQVARWQAALQGEGLTRGDRVAVMLPNGREWVCFEQAALGLGLVVVPLYVNDRAENAAYILRDAGAKLLLIGGLEHWRTLADVREKLDGLHCIVVVRAFDDMDPLLTALQTWLPADAEDLRTVDAEPDELATIVYTSGTTGNPKGVMLSHRNILWNAHACVRIVPVYPRDVFLSFLPLSHTLERTVGHYVPMMAGAEVAHARSIAQLAEDLVHVRPTIMISVPRIFERIYAKMRAQLDERPPLARRLFALAVEIGWQRFQHTQGRAPWQARFLLWPLLDALIARKLMEKLGGRLRLTICGGAPLSNDIAHVFLGLGVPLIQGYGLTEMSPVVSSNVLSNNDPAGVGPPLPDVEVRLGKDNELQVRSPGVMLGYWQKPEATAALIDADGWLHTGDVARIERGHIYITGRLKEIIVLANGEKVPPADMEAAICRDAIFEQVVVLGEGKPFLCALAVLHPERWTTEARALGVDPAAPDALRSEAVEKWALRRIAAQLREFPGYAQVRRVSLSLSPWTVENGLLTPTLKTRRARILVQYDADVMRLYQGH